jgi:hypothetical protein
MGTHKELLKKCKVYKQIALSQLSEEELAWDMEKKHQKNLKIFLDQ